MTRNHGTVMSLSYDAPCPERKTGRRKKRTNAKTKEARDTSEEEEPLLRNTYGVTAVPYPSFSPRVFSTRDLRACSKSRFPARRSLYSTLLPAINTSPAHHSSLPPMSFSSFILVLVLSRFIYVPLPSILFIFRFRVLTNCNDVFKVARITLTNSLYVLWSLMRACLSNTHSDFCRFAYDSSLRCR